MSGAGWNASPYHNLMPRGRFLHARGDVLPRSWELANQKMPAQPDLPGFAPRRAWTGPTGQCGTSTAHSQRSGNISAIGNVQGFERPRLHERIVIGRTKFSISGPRLHITQLIPHALGTRQFPAQSRLRPRGPSPANLVYPTMRPQG